KIRGLAQKQKMTLNEWGLYRLDQYEKAKKETAKPPFVGYVDQKMPVIELTVTPAIEQQLNSRLRSPSSEHSVPSSLPVLFFGDPFSATTATVGLNPSDQEYLDPEGTMLTAALQRFETVESLGAESREKLTADQCRRAVRRMRGYFEVGRPVYQWFASLS